MTMKLLHILKVTLLSCVVLNHASFAEEGVVAPRPEGTERPSGNIPATEPTKITSPPVVITESSQPISAAPVTTTPNIEKSQPTPVVITESVKPTSVPTTPVTTTPIPETPVASTTVSTPSVSNTAPQYTAADPFSMTSTVFSADELNDSRNVSAQLQMFSLETRQNTLGLLFSFADLQKDAEIISAQLIFTNARDNEYVDGQLRFYAENNPNPEMFSLENLPSQRELGKYYANYVNQYQRKQGAVWRADVSAPVQALFKSGNGGQRIVLIAKGMSAQAVQTPFLNYTFNENTVKLSLILKNSTITNTTAVSHVLTDKVLNELKALPSVKPANLKRDADVLQADIGDICFKFQADNLQSNYLRVATTEVHFNKSKVSFNLATGETLNAHAVVQNLSTLQSALQAIAAVQNVKVQNDGTVLISLANDSLFLLRPDASSTPNNQLAAGLVEQNNQTFLVFYDNLGVLRQQALYPVALYPEELQAALQNIAPAVQLSEENGVLTVNVAGQNFQAKLSHIVSKNLDNSPLGLRVIGDINHDGKADYQMTYRDGKVQVLYSL
jgi:hypothetical protein